MIVKKGQSSVVSKKASDYKEQQIKSSDEDSPTYKNDKLVNIIYNEGEYHIYEP